MIDAAKRDELRREAKGELADIVEDAFYTAVLFTKAGDHETAKRIAAHAHALKAIGLMTR